MKLSSKRVIKASELEALQRADLVCDLDSPPYGHKADSEVAAASELGRPGASLKAELEEIRAEAAETAAATRKQAEEEAAAILADAQSQAQKVRDQEGQRGFAEGFDKGKEQGYQDGLIQGKQEGLEEIRQKWMDLIQELIDTVSCAVTVRDVALERSEEDILKLSLAVAEKIIRRSVSYDMSCTVGIVRAALERVNGARTVRVRVNPALVMAMEENRAWLTGVKGVEKVEFVEDPDIEPGGCLVETDFGRIDGRLDTRISEVASALMEVLDHVRD